MEISGVLNALFRWVHIIAGIVWIGHLYFFNFVNIRFAALMKDAGVAKTTVPQLMPRALFWFRWGAAWTWITGVVLLMLVFYHGRIMFDGEGSWGAGAFISLAVVFGGFVIYDVLFKSVQGQNANYIAFGLVVAAVLVMVFLGKFGYRAYTIHLGSMFGTIMAFNVWFRIWPAQKRIITAIGAGQAPDPADPALAGLRSRHNTYMSVPLLWTMIDQHSAGTAFSTFGWIGLLVIVLLSWHVTWQLYRVSTDDARVTRI